VQRKSYTQIETIKLPLFTLPALFSSIKYEREKSVMQSRQQPVLRRKLDISPVRSFHPTMRSCSHHRFRFFAALFIALTGLTGFLIVLATAIIGG
jgi:hypothetical protein